MEKILKKLRKIPVFIVLIAIFAFFSVGCSSENDNPPADSPNVDNDSPTETTSYEDWEQKCLDSSYTDSYIDYIYTLATDDEISSATKKSLSSVLEIKTSSSTGGSGVIFDIDEENNVFVITNYHVVYNKNISAPYSSFTAKLYGSSETFSLEFIGGSATYDIAVLYGTNVELLETKNTKPAIFNLNSVENSSTCLALGNADLKGIKATKGKVTNLSEYYTAEVAGLELEHRFICHDTKIVKGNSGGGLFNTSGELVGITNGALKESSTKLAIPASIVYAATKNIIANCFEKENNQIIEYSLGFKLFSNITENDNVLIKIDNINSEIWPDLQAGDQLLSFKITTPDETIIKTVTNLFDLDDYKMLLVENSTIELTLKRDGVTENIIASANYSQLPNDIIA